MEKEKVVLLSVGAVKTKRVRWSVGAGTEGWV